MSDPSFENNEEDESRDSGEEGHSARRRELVARAVETWKKQLIELGGRNNLLAYRDLKAGTLDLSDADPRAVTDLVIGKSVPLGRLWRDPETLADAQRRARTIHKKALEHFEERGIETLFLAFGLASWRPGALSLKNPRAPVLIRPAALVPRGAAQQEFELVLLGEFRVSGTLLQVLAQEFACTPDMDTLVVDGAIDTMKEITDTFDWLLREAAEVPEFEIERRAVLGTFSYMKMPMVRDLDDALELLIDHDLVATIAGDDEARVAFRESQGTVTVALDEPNTIPLNDEFLVLDADSSQNWAINAVLRGQSLIVRGPPGTGKSQTISNLIASLTARGKRVLFVAEKRAAIEAVLKRLDAVGLSDLVFDIHGGVAARRAVAQSLGASTENARAIGAIDVSELHRQLDHRRSELVAASEALHRPREPFGLSVYEAMNRVLGVPASAHTEFRLRASELLALSGEQESLAEEALEELTELGGLALEHSGSQWAKATVTSSEEVRDAFDTVERLRSTVVRRAQTAVQAAGGETGARELELLAEWNDAHSVWAEAEEILTAASPTLFELPLEEIQDALDPADDGAFSRFWATLSSSSYRSAHGQVKQTLQKDLGSAARLALVEQAVSVRDRWQKLAAGPERAPSAPANLAELTAALGELDRELEHLRRYLGRDAFKDVSDEDLLWTLDELHRDQGTLGKLPRIHALMTQLRELKLTPLLDELIQRDLVAALAPASLRYAWCRSIVEHVRLEDPTIGSFDGRQHAGAVARYQDLDAQHLDSTADRILRLWAERAAAARNDYPDEVALIRQQAARRRKLLPFRELFVGAKDYLLELKPCWVMSPLVVSQTLPPEQLFDVVIFDEASQVRPADAIPAIVRGAQLVVAGDEKQLPPSAFFLAATQEEEDASAEDAPQLAAVEGFESILEALGMLLPARTLEWHYRSRDERLIAFSNANFYDWHLTTFPGINDSQPISHVLVPHRAGLVGQEDSASDEVAEVVRQIITHAETRPSESLGVIAMGIKHADRVEGVLFEALKERPELDEFFNGSGEERFFVKNLERVQGDERDAILLTVGYGKTPEGRLLYHFGPLNLEGGARRLNVAVTRARRRLTLVSSFGSHDMDPNRQMSDGAALLRDYLRYAESGGANLGEHALERPALNPFEIDVRDTLARNGISVVPQLGVCGYLIDFAVQHPRELGRFVLAIECDGATYHSSATARDRDRLRQEQLERLGWRFHRIWSTDWFSRKDEALNRAIAAVEEAVELADNPDLLPAPTDNGEPHEAPLTVRASEMRGRRPNVGRHLPIDAYSQGELVELARWIKSDSFPRSDDELLEAVMADLGFQRRGKKIVSAISRAVQQANASDGPIPPT